MILTKIINRSTASLIMASGGDEAEFSRLVMDVSLRKYSALPKKGKPKEEEEWTPLATILCCEGIIHA